MTRRSEAAAVSISQQRFRVVSVFPGLLLAVGLSSQPARAQQQAREQAQQPPPGLPLGSVVNAPAGPVQGLNNNGVLEYLGIPYAQPPVGALRWRPPHPHPPWMQTLNATHFGPTCAQTKTLGAFAGPPNKNEDCLFLNIFTPQTAKPGTLPVLVWIHGGGNIDGESNDYDGSKLASQGQMVVVTMNYRLGLLGWLANPALDSEGHPFGNYGLLDQQLVLKWVRNNIASFGGDPDRVALGGQSAGSYDTAANVVSPLAVGLFDRAIFMSVLENDTPLVSAEQVGTAFSVAAGCSSGATPTIATCLRSLSAQTIMNLQGTESANGPYVTTFNIAEGTILPSQGIFNAFMNGNFTHIPIMSGFTHDEYNFFIVTKEYFSGVPVSEADVTNYVETTYGANGAKVLAVFNPSSYPMPQLALDAIGTSSFVVCKQYTLNKALSSQVPFYAYEFNDQTAPSYFPGLPGYRSLAYHTGDIQYLFPLYHGGPNGIPHPLNSQQETLSDELVAAWANFARTGNPNRHDNSPWPRYDANQFWSSYYLSENISDLSLLRDKQVSREHKCSFIDFRHAQRQLFLRRAQKRFGPDPLPQR